MVITDIEKLVLDDDILELEGIDNARENIRMLIIILYLE